MLIKYETRGPCRNGIALRPVGRGHISVISVKADPDHATVGSILEILAKHETEIFNLDIHHGVIELAVTAEAFAPPRKRRSLTIAILGERGVRTIKIDAMPTEAPGMNAKTGAPHRRRHGGAAAQTLMDKPG